MAIIKTKKVEVHKRNYGDSKRKQPKFDRGVTLETEKARTTLEVLPEVATLPEEEQKELAWKDFITLLLTYTELIMEGWRTGGLLSDGFETPPATALGNVQRPIATSPTRGQQMLLQGQGKASCHTCAVGTSSAAPTLIRTRTARPVGRSHLSSSLEELPVEELTS
ncbi:hypothetical protein MDA_GLEAN10011639 [Myotis davidii]|uniref:Uncharacterized protein n=1 Tax=Myotis davidii TaxID=225400 RepID=L5MJE1_MYODS|nr:hypothetical protein MDA_GLEAN10011639 [Myotis davidii]